MARGIRVFDMALAPYPSFPPTLLLAAAIYDNWFAHHFLPGIRPVLFAANVLPQGRIRIWLQGQDLHWWMPLPEAAFLSARALWLAENVGTATGTWICSGQLPGQIVSFAKLGSWYLLLYMAFVTVTLASRGALSSIPHEKGPAGNSRTLAKS